MMNQVFDDHIEISHEIYWDKQSSDIKYFQENDFKIVDFEA